MDGKINGHEYSLKATSPNRLQELSKADELLQEFNEENPDELYLFDKDFRGKYLKEVADVIIDWEEEDFNPNTDFFADGEFEVSNLQQARRAFLGSAGMIAV